MQVETLQIGGLTFVGSKSAMTKSSDGNPVSGYFKRLKNRTMFFMAGKDNEALCLVENKKSAPFFVTAHKLVRENKWRYLFSTTSTMEREFQLPEGYLDCCNLAASLARPRNHVGDE